MQQTLMESISSGRKMRLHARIGEALEAAYGNNPEGHTSELAHHFTQAASVLGNDRMIHYTLMAGERALATHAWEEALGHFIRGLEAKNVDPDGRLPAVDAEAAGLLFGLSRARSADLRFRPGYIKQVVANLRSAFEYHLAAGDNERAVVIAQSPPRVLVGDRGGLADVAEAALGIAPPGTVAKGQLLANYAWLAAMEQNDYPAAERSFQEALEIARDSGDVLLLQRILAQAAQVDFYHRRFEEAIERSKQILSIPAPDLEMTTECAARYVYCVSAMSIGAPPSTEELEAFISVAEMLGDRLWLHLSYWLPQRTAALYGDWERSREFGNKGLTVAPGAPTLLSSMPQTELETGEFERAEELFQQLSDRLSEYPVNANWRYAATVAASRISSFITGKPREPALPTSFWEIASSSPYAMPLFVSVTDSGRALEALTQGDEETCRSAYEALKSSPGRLALVVSVDRLLGQLAAAIGYNSQAMAHFEDSLAFCSKAGYQPEYAWTCWAYSTALVARGDSGDRRRAEELLKQALTIATDLGMPPLLARVENLMPKTGGGAAPANPGGLTQREVEVIRLVSSGMTDREIGETLFISVKTVGNHLSNILNKTDSANRAEAASYANQHGLITSDADDAD
jgi:DNA-binding CsgD family transcriptional regulator